MMRYLAMADELRLMRELGVLSEDDEERYAVALNDMWRDMSADERVLIEDSLRAAWPPHQALKLIDA